ncbi:alpha/beta hydrolase [Saccharopolyspora flava]|uniref:Alpha/beta hydrolase fold n=1 Tax=Saccharopolyspora flava TaxID=95161 RepID=A0A1I6QSZ0_9PSEU|nr:alpha/beta hydrolase [Saccharopolyspora flava]SFS55543.1 alpha/beta hydrolase fold [Saccharopolyspora flava]
MKRRCAVVLAVVIGAASSLIAPPAMGEGLAWGPCPADVKAEAVALECAEVPVPLDYGDPGGERIDLMISRVVSARSGQKRDVLMLNPGGPGGSGLAYADLLVSLGMPASVLEHYDVIGMDTRGVGHSARVSCGFTTEQGYPGNIPPYAVDDAAVLAQAEASRRVAEQCAAHDPRLRHLSTANMARDLDRIRSALGAEKTSFLGYSYGSALGAAYASMFPERSDRVVLDSNIGDSHLDRDGMRRYASGFELAFPDFARWAAERDETYGFGPTPDAVRQTYFRLAARADQQAVDGVDGKLFRLSTFVGLFRESTYEQTAQTWRAVRDGVQAPPPAPEPGPSPWDNEWSVFLAVTCNDVAWPGDVATYRQAVAEDRDRYPMFGAAAANISPCAFWPPPAEPPVAIEDEGPANVLVVQNRRDPITPHRGGELVDERFGPRSRLVSVDAGGHGAYLIGDNACARATTTDFLLGGELPDDDVSCR